MAGAIIENMSTKKLCIVGGILLVFQIIAFLVGGLIVPSNQLREGNVIDFIRNNRRVGELRPAQIRSSVTRLRYLHGCKCIWSSLLDAEGLHFGVQTFAPCFPAALHPTLCRVQ
ncbi:hypothetical protein H8959_006438, partial [Pygathrix nigripes]